MVKRNILKKNVHYDKNEVINKAEELERRAKNLHKISSDFEGDDFELTRARLFGEAAEHYLNAKKPRKAKICFELAWKHFEKLAVPDYGAMKAYFAETSVNAYKKYGKEFEKSYINKERLNKVLKGKWHGLEGKTVPMVVAIGGILGSIFFFSNKLTGNAIADLSSQNSSIFGGVLFFIGILGILFYFKNKK